MKQICNVHHFSYDGKRCPFCESERLERLAKRFVTEDYVVKNSATEREASAEDFKKLSSKFNVRFTEK